LTVPSVRPAAWARSHLFQHRHAGSAAAQRSMPAGGERACGARVDLARAIEHREDAQHGALRAGQVRERELHLPAAQRAPGCLSMAEGSGGLRRHLTGADRRRGGQRTSDLSRHTGSVRRCAQLQACAQAAVRGAPNAAKTIAKKTCAARQVHSHSDRKAGRRCSVKTEQSRAAAP